MISSLSAGRTRNNEMVQTEKLRRSKWGSLARALEAQQEDKEAQMQHKYILQTCRIRLRPKSSLGAVLQYTTSDFDD